MLNSVGAGQTLLADRAYDSDALRETLAERGAKANIKPMRHRVNIPKFNKRLYKKRNLIDRSLTKLNISEQSPPASKNTTPLPRPRQTRLSQNLDAVYESVTLEQLGRKRPVWFDSARRAVHVSSPSTKRCFRVAEEP